MGPRSRSFLTFLVRKADKMCKHIFHFIFIQSSINVKFDKEEIFFFFKDIMVTDIMVNKIKWLCDEAYT